MKKKVLLFLIFLSFCSCNTEIENKKKNSIRINVMSEPLKEVTFKVFFENYLGQAVNSGLVIVESQSGIAEILSFNNDQQCYIGTLDGGDEDIYQVIVKSTVLDYPYIISVPHVRLQTKPILTCFSDSEGNNVLKGEILKKDNKIQISWTPPSKEELIYQVIIKNALNVKWASSVSSSTIIVPESVLEKGNYYLIISAQKSYGDIFYDLYPYYSVSNISSSTVSFCVE